MIVQAACVCRQPFIIRRRVSPDAEGTFDPGIILIESESEVRNRFTIHADRRKRTCIQEEMHMSESVYLMEVIKELERNAHLVREEELQAAADLILASDRIFVAGAGRSGFAARGFSNRLMHLGRTVYFVSEPTTPSIGKGDLLWIASGSGQTGSMRVMAETAKGLGAALATVTIHPEGAIGQMADTVIRLPGGTPKSSLEDTCPSIQIMADAFEQMSWIVYDVLIHELMERTGVTEEEMFSRHANLE